MGERAHILQYDRTSAGGTVLDGLDDVCRNDRKLSYLGARVQCPACNSIGRIGPDGTRPANDLVGRQRALEGDFCLCACSPKPTLIASQKDWTLDT
jgi:uncharacterized Zn-binding protein involved in type VI secretion